MEVVLRGLSWVLGWALGVAATSPAKSDRERMGVNRMLKEGGLQGGLRLRGQSLWLLYRA